MCECVFSQTKTCAWSLNVPWNLYWLWSLVLSWESKSVATSSRAINSDVDDLNNECDLWNLHFMNLRKGHDSWIIVPRESKLNE